MPVFNGGHYFQAALESALAQDYPNLEILVVNDGSTDAGETERIALAQGDRIRYFHQENRGVAGAMNTALAHMTGDYFAWLSHDDLHLPHKTASQMDYLRRLGRPDACLFADFDLIGPQDEFIASVRLPVERIHHNPRLPLYNGMINGCTLLIPTAFLREFGPFDETLRCTQDYDLWNRILARHEFFHQPEVLVRYRIHPGQGTHSARAVSEGDTLWKAMLDSRSEIERAQMFGSTRHYFASLAGFLAATPYQQATAYARTRAAEGCEDVLVSVVMAVCNRAGSALRAVRSVLAQTHRRVEVVLVDDGSSDSFAGIAELAAADGRVRLLRQASVGPVVARNRALQAARGDYVALLDANDQFLPLKIERQLGQMQRYGALFSYTSHYVACPGRKLGLGLRRSANSSTDYPRIIGMCPIGMSTVMMHRSLVDEGFAFRTDVCGGEDWLAWIDLSMRYSLLDIDEPLSIVEWAEDGALDPARQVLALSGVLEALQRHPIHHRNPVQFEKVRATLLAITRNWKAAGRNIEAIRPEEQVNEAYPELPAFPLGGTGEVPPLRARMS